MDLPTDWLDIERAGLHLCGISPTGEVHDEPADGDETGIRIRVTLSKTLDYEWNIISASQPDGKHFRTGERAELGITAIDDDIDRHLSWSRSSVLWRLTEKQDELTEALRNAEDEVRGALAAGDLTALDPVVEQAKSMAKTLATGRAGDELASQFAEMLLSPGNVELAAGGVPIKSFGLGTRRLLVMGLQLLTIEQPQITLVDEVEHGLEPHRVTHLLRTLIRRAGKPDANSNQVFMTSHSPVALAELGAERLSVVRDDGNGNVTVTDVPPELTKVVRSAPEAFLAQSVIVGEGPTEVGLLWGQYVPWADVHDGAAPAHLGVVAIDGVGSSAGEKAETFNALGYRTLIFGDSDVDFKPPAVTLQGLGITTVQWEGKMATESRLFADISWDAIPAVIQVAIDDGREMISLMSAVQTALTAAAGTKTIPAGGFKSLKDFEDAGYSQQELRAALGASANKGKWFKRYGLAQSVSEVVHKHIHEMKTTDTAIKLAAIESWIYR